MFFLPFTRAPLHPLLGTPLGHVWTIGYHLGRKRQTGALGATQPFDVGFEDPLTGNITLNGTLHTTDVNVGSVRNLVVLIHGLGGSADSGYMFEATRTALALGFAVLRMSLRGADPFGTDFYHAGLWPDVARVLAHERVQAFDNVYVLGVSLGGHVVLRAAGSDMPSNVRAVAALCPPLDLGACSQAFDRKRQWLFRRHVLDGLKQMYARFAAEHPQVGRKLDLPTAPQAFAIQSIGEWDRAIVAPRHGFPSAQEYYATQSAGPRLEAVHVPALIVTARWDPMVPHATTAHLLKPHGDSVSEADVAHTSDEGAPPGAWSLRSLTPHVCHTELAVGGHIAFPQRGELSVFTQTLHWLKRHPRP